MANGDVPVEGVQSSAEEPKKTVFQAFESLVQGGLAQPTAVDKYVKLQYPLDVEGPEEKHFMRFEPLTIRGAILQTEQIGRTRADQDSNPNLTKAQKFGKTIGSTLGTAASLAATGAIKNVVGSKLPGSVVESIGFISGLVLSAANVSKSTGHGSIILYTPPNLTEQYAPQWNTAELGALGAIGADALSRAASGGGVSDAATSVMNQMTNTRQGVTLSGKLFSDMVGQSINSQGLGATLLKRASSQAVNPHLEALFQNVQFRTFSFSFVFAPRNRKEAKEVHEIIQSFKYFSAPGFDRSSSGVFFKYPDVFNISYFNEKQMHKFHPCALTSINVTRSPFETNVTFYDGHPVQTQMDLQFMEVALVTKEHIDRGF